VRPQAEASLLVRVQGFLFPTLAVEMIVGAGAEILPAFLTG